jgi:hypothetical protein
MSEASSHALSKTKQDGAPDRTLFGAPFHLQGEQNRDCSQS